MRTFIRIAAAASVVVALVSVLIHVGAVAFANEWDQRGDDTSGWVGVLHGLLASLLPLGFIWLGVFVVYLVVKEGGSSKRVEVSPAQSRHATATASASQI